MKKRLFLALAIIFSVVSLYSQNGFNLKSLHLFPEGELVDSSNITVTFRPFYLSAQITNVDFREFWDFVKANPDNELKWVEMPKLSDDNSKPQPTIKKIKYSDIATISFNQENWPNENYFYSEEYNYSPVIGISSDLKFYFCVWLTDRLHSNSSDSEVSYSSNYYIPSEYQLEYASKIEPSFFAEDECGFRVAIAK